MEASFVCVLMKTGMIYLASPGVTEHLSSCIKSQVYVLTDVRHLSTALR